MDRGTFRSTQRRLLAKANGGISLPVAGALYWLALGISGFFLPERLWIFGAAFGSGLIFPIGLLLSKPLDSRLFITDEPLAQVAGFAVLAINLLWPLYFAIIAVAPNLLPLALGIGMCLHWPIIGWMYGSRACVTHAIVRVLLVSALWVWLPAERLTLLPLAVALLYLVTVVWLRREATTARSLG